MDYDADPMSMTKEQFIAEAENIVDCDCYDGKCSVFTCHYKEVDGGSWDTCVEGRLSHWCDWLPKEAKK